MKSDQENSFEFFDKIRENVKSSFVKYSGKLPLSRLNKLFIWERNDKAKILKAKYGGVRHQARSVNKKLLPQKIHRAPAENKTEPAAVQSFSQRLKTKGTALLSKTSQVLGSLPQRLHIQEFSKRTFDKAKKVKVTIASLEICSVNRLSFKRLRPPQTLDISGLSSKLMSFFKSPKFSLSQLNFSGGFFNSPGSRKIGAGVTLIALTVFLVGANLKVEAYAIKADGKTIAVTTEKAATEKLLSELKAEKARIWNRKVDVKQQLVIENIRAKRYELDSQAALKDKLNENITFVAVATGLKVNGEVAVIVKDTKAAQALLEELKKSYVSEDINIEEVALAERIEFADVPASLKDVMDMEEALRVLKEGKEQKLTHVVDEGDSLWSIARANDLHVEDLLKANPSIKGEHLDLGQEINLVALKPVVNVVVTGKRTVEEKVPYKVVVQTDRSMWRGREKVKTPGENGSKEVTYKLVMKNGVVVEKDVLDEKVIKAATNKVVVRGSKLVVASRNSGGRLGWPISGKITSSYGRRWGQMHTGLDIDGYTGQPVGAAAAGVVTAAGRDGAYGLMVTIKHDNGLVTRYAHLSKIEASVGQKVDRGDLIGLVGSTGRSTGSHLHFEVRSGGSFKNPITYLR